MSPSRILFTGTLGVSIPPPYVGIPKRALMLATEWKKSGIKTGFTFTYHHDKENDLGADGEYFFEYQKKPNKFSKILFIIKYAFANPKLYFYLLSQYKKTYRQIDRQGILYPAYGVFLNSVYHTFKPDIVIAETALIQTFMAGHVAAIHHIPFVIETYAEVHDASMTKSLPFNNEERTVYWKNFLGLADHIITPSYYCAHGPLAYVPKEKTTMVYATTLDVDRFDKTISPSEKSAIRKELGIPDTCFLIMAVGAFTLRKGHDHIIEAVAMAQKEYPTIAVALCGAGEPDWLTALAKEKEIVEKVFFFRNLSEEGLTKLYHAADCYCDASNTPRACLGIALTDALAAHLPVIAYDIAGLPESVHHNENGLIVPVNNIPALSSAIISMSTKSPAEREAMGIRGLNIARHIFDLPIIAKQLLETLIRVIEAKR